MDSANLAAGWFSACATVIGLGSLVTQSAAIRNQLDIFHETRGKEHLGVWATIQHIPRWYSLTKPAPIGPIIGANLDGCLGQSTVFLSRKPMYLTGKATWTALLTVFHRHPVEVENWHPSATAVRGNGISDNKESFTITVDQNATITGPAQARPPAAAQWVNQLERESLIHHKNAACTTVTRETLITFLLLSQARQIYRYSEAVGLRMAYGSYNGYYHIEWPLGGSPTLHFVAHHGHPFGKDYYPETFSRSPKQCIEMGLGVIDLTEDGSKVAFAGRKAPGRWALERLRNRYSAQKTAADLYNDMGGQSHDVDFLFRRQLEEDGREPPHVLQLVVPSLEDSKKSILYLDQEEVDVIAACLDHLPWSSLAWSIHRGMKDVLVAYGRQVMDAYRRPLSSALHKAVEEKGRTLVDQNWQPKFVADSMASQAASAILGGEECSGDACRIVSAAALLLCEENAQLRPTRFWRERIKTRANDEEIVPTELTSDAVIALVKLFFVQWSHEFDYGIGFDLPWELTFI